MNDDTVPSDLSARDLPSKAERQADSGLLLQIVIGGVALLLILGILVH